jgi:hypothetical protein
MGEGEAEYIAATVAARINPRTWWEETSTEPYRPSPEAAAPAKPRRRRQLRILGQIVFPLLVLAAIASLLVAGRRDSDEGSSAQPPPDNASPRVPLGPPDPFATRRAPRLRKDVLRALVRQNHGLEHAGLQTAPDLVPVDLHRHRAVYTDGLRRAHASLPLLRGLSAPARRKFRRPRRSLRTGAASAARRLISGADGTRTRGLRAASASLSQLSYGPWST